MARGSRRGMLPIRRRGMVLLIARLRLIVLNWFSKESSGFEVEDDSDHPKEDDF
jgi:hypothetical protein